MEKERLKRANEKKSERIEKGICHFSTVASCCYNDNDEPTIKNKSKSYDCLYNYSI